MSALPAVCVLPAGLIQALPRFPWLAGRLLGGVAGHHVRGVHVGQRHRGHRLGHGRQHGPRQVGTRRTLRHLAHPPHARLVHRRHPVEGCDLLAVPLLLQLLTSPPTCVRLQRTTETSALPCRARSRMPGSASPRVCLCFCDLATGSPAHLCVCWSADKKIALLGFTQSFFEGAMYVFVFMWTPALESTRSVLGFRVSCAVRYLTVVVVGGAVSFRFLAAASSRSSTAGSSPRSWFVRSCPVIY